MSFYSCHRATEMWPNLVIGGIRDVDDMLIMGVEILVPLDYLEGNIWDRGFRGEILFCPIRDGHVLPDDVLERLTDRICRLLGEGRRVGIFCIGGHGRTGYVAACVLARLGVEDPISYLREKYCRHAVETEEQEEAVRAFIGLSQKP